MRTLALNIIRPEPPLRSYAVGRTPWSAAGPLASPLGFKPSVSVFIALLLTLPLAAAEAPPTRLEALEKTVETQRRLLKDWGGLLRYGSEDSELPAPKLNEIRVIFLGDEVTLNWSEFFPGKPYFNRGIEHQTSAQMLIRFQQDVIALKPKVVVIQAGFNDIVGNTLGVSADNYYSMVQLAKANGIKVVIASLTPVSDFYKKQTGMRPVGKIISMNGWLRDYAATAGAVYLNYYAALATSRDFNKDLTSDGLLPNATGYKVMSDLAEKAIAEALTK